VNKSKLIELPLRVYAVIVANINILLSI